MSQAIADDLARVPMSPNLVATLARAAERARRQGHVRVTPEHMLLALTEDPDAGLVLQASGVARDRLATETTAQLAALPVQLSDQPQAPVSLAPELKRVLEAAAVAAQQGRRQVSGAILLAAIVGEGKTTAAQLLRTHGLTFETAIRALQQAGRAQQQRQIAPSPRPVSQASPTATPSEAAPRPGSVAADPRPAAPVPEAAPAPRTEAPPPLPPTVHQDTAPRQPAAPLEARQPRRESTTIETSPAPDTGGTQDTLTAPWPAVDDPALSAPPQPAAPPVMRSGWPAAAARQHVQPALAPAEPELPAHPHVERSPPRADSGGQLIENIPRRMRDGVPVPVEVRLVEDMDAPPAAIDARIQRALTVHLSAPDGGFRIEADATETQWVGQSQSHQGQALARWRWTVTPESAGRRHLQLGVSARWVGPDGVSPEIAAQPQAVVVAVARNWARQGRRLLAVAGLVAAGALIGIVGGGAMTAILGQLRRLLPF